MDVITAMHTSQVEALWTRFEARDWAGARRLFADDATLTWHTSGERMLDADAIIRVNAIYPEGWRIRIVEINPLQDGRVHSIVEVLHGAQRFLANSLFRFDDAGSIAEVDEYFATFEAPPAWRTAEAIGAYERFSS
ncbi:nuclear transport factor 2 family protein [soil metagenome]